MTREEFNTLIMRQDHIGMHAVGRALVHLMNRQTRDEQETKSTRHHNGRGFTSSDARSGTITAKYYIKHGVLQAWQLDMWRARNRRGTTRLGKYYAQIAEEAKAKERIAA